jgi:hypothetical protein
MERLRLIYEQMEEAKRLIQSGTLPHVRLALILLDNAAELIMYRELTYEFLKHDFYKRIRQHSQVASAPAHFAPKYSDEERDAAEREFTPMVKILSLRLGMISEKQATVLRVCHEMRRDAFHRGEMNPAILRPVTELLFLTVAEMAKAFPVHSYSISGAVPTGENLDFLARFGIREYELGGENGKEKIYSKLVAGISATDSLCETLSRDLEERIDGTIEALSYLNDGSSNRGQLDHNLRYAQFWRERGAEVAKKAHEEERASKDDLDTAYQEWSENPGPRFTMDKVERWRRQASAIAKAKHHAEALAKYWGIERRFAPLEEDISRAVADFDEHINTLVKDRR